jgi:uncharacterized protein (TIGR02391 family)
VLEDFFNKSVRVLRLGPSGEPETTEVKAVVGDTLIFAVTTDVEEGDLVEWDLPSGKIKTVRLTNVVHYEAPPGFGAGGDMSSIEATYVSASRPQPVVMPVFDLPGLHSSISKASGALYRDGHYRQAVFDAFQAVEHRVQALTGREESGRDLMGKVFGGATPALDVTRATGRSAEDERGGFAQLFMGAMLAIRNPRGHGSAVQDSAEEAMEYLALASTLMRRLDVAEDRS